MMTNRFAYISKLFFYLTAAALPVAFLPLPFGADTGREIIFAVLILGAGLLWLAATLGKGEFRYPVSPILWGAGVLAVVWTASAALSGSPMVSAFFAEPQAERVMTLGLGLVLMIAMAGVLETRGEARLLLFVLLSSGAVAALLSLYTFLVGPIGFIPIQPHFNVIGTINGLALFYAVLLAMTLGLILSSGASQWYKGMRWLLGIAGVLFLLNLLLIHFSSAWIVLLAAGVCLFGLSLIDRSTSLVTGASRAFGRRQWGALAVSLCAIAMMMSPAPLIKRLDLPAEVSPSVSATFAVAGSVFREGPLRVFLGSGPATFGIDWTKYKDPSVNQTVFWGVRFNQGQSWIVTALPTAGVIGFGVLTAFFVVTIATLLRALFAGPSRETLSEVGDQQNDGLAISAVVGCISLIIAACLYPGVTSLILLLFLTVGLGTTLLARRASAAEGSITAFQEQEVTVEDGVGTTDIYESEMNVTASEESMPVARSFWEIRERVIRLSSPWAVFASSLAIIFFIALGIAGLYTEAGRVRAVLAAGRGIDAFGQGKTDDALAHLERAVAAEPGNYHNLQLLVQVRTEKVRQVIQRAAGGTDVRQEFQAAVSSAIQDSQRLTALYPQDPLLWRLQGAVYETVIPFIQGSERFAGAAYQHATELEPGNPAAYVDWGRAGLVFTDRLASLAEQAQGKDRETLLKTRTDNLNEIAVIFQRAIQVKPDYAPAHFLLAQTAIRLGNLDVAIASVENTKLVAPFDIGVAFQLGLLYYQKSDLDRAAAEFERAITMNEQYANARYFLGLIYDRKKDVAGALAQFERIAATNPDNPEIQRIIANLHAGKPALDGIVPPAPPPQQRADVPIREQERKK